MAMVSGALEDAAKGSVGLDVLKVGYDGVQGTTLIAGRYVAPQLYVGFRQPLQTMNNNTTSLDESSDTKVELEYAAYRWLVLNVQGESSFIRSYLRFRREY
jgi:autotransporter translocation and assembly factor TamB